MAKHAPSPAAQRSNVKNPNNAAYQADRMNRLSQGHANQPPPPPAQQSSGSSEPKR